MTHSSASQATAFLNTGDFTYRVRTSPLARPTSSVNVRITTQWATARDAAAEQVALDLTLSPSELDVLVAALQAAQSAQAAKGADA